MHRQPKSTQTILYEEPNDPTRRENLRCSWNIGFLEFLLLFKNMIERSVFLFGYKELVDPTNRLFIAGRPPLFHIFCVEFFKNATKDTWSGKQPTGQIVGIKQNAHFFRKLFALPQKEVAIRTITGPFLEVILRHGPRVI